jgi:O-antigen/teichoic acid export membrane protein
VVSVTNFLTTVIVGRAAGQDALGAYALAFSVMLLFLCMQQSLVCLPYTIKVCHLKPDERRGLTGSALLQAIFLSAILSLVMAIGIGATAFSSSSAITTLLVALAVAMPFALLRDFARRISFAQFNMPIALAIDGSVFALQIWLLVILWRSSLLTATTTYLAIAIACATAGLFWVWHRRREFSLSWRVALSDIRWSWPLGGWVLGSQIVTVANSYLIFWLAAAKLGMLASGTLAACNVIIQLSNPILLGTYNILSPRLAVANAQEGSQGVARVARQTTVFLAVVMALFCVVAFIFGDFVVRILYGNTYAIAEVGIISGLMGLAELASAIGGAPDQVLWVRHRPSLSFWTGLTGLGCMVIAANWLIPAWGLIGVVSALVMGNSVASALRWFAFNRLIGGQSDEG